MSMMLKAKIREHVPSHREAERCYLCGSPAVREKYPRSGPVVEESSAFRCTSMHHASKPRVVACGNCGLAYIPKGEVTERLLDLYSGVVDETYLKYQDGRRKTFRSVYRKIAPFLPKEKGKLLEVGCYCGLYLEIARDEGWEVQGVEPSLWAAQYCRDEMGLPVHRGTLDDCPDLKKGTFDVAVMWDVLEHLEDPRRVLYQANQLLQKGGILCLSTLDIDNWIPRLFGRRWPWFMDMHLFYFRRRIMGRLFAQAGFELVSVQPYCHHIAVEYFLEKLAHLIPRFLSWLPRALRAVTPKSLFIPFQFGDIKLYIARKTRA